MRAMQDARAEAPPVERTTRGTALVALAVALFSAVVPVALDAFGRSARRGCGAPPGGSDTLLVRTDAETVRGWFERGCRGRTVVHFGRFLHYVDDELRSSTTR